MFFYPKCIHLSQFMYYLGIEPTTLVSILFEYRSFRGKKLILRTSVCVMMMWYNSRTDNYFHSCQLLYIHTESI